MHARILRWTDLDNRDWTASELDAIFFEASATKTFASDAERFEFRERWLGRYLREDAGHAYIAVTGANNAIIGYVAGSLADPALTDRFQDIGYFAHLKALTRRFPAHLHVNLAKEARGMGIGSQLLATFIADASRSGSPGVHVVTSPTARNAGFYRRNGFVTAEEFDWNGRPLLFLGRSIKS